MFFYRSWLASDDGQQQPDHFLNLQTPFEFAKWIYLALLVATMLTCCGLNFAFLISFVQNGMGGFRKIPNVVFLCMTVRDLIVCTVLIPICIDWYVIENGKFTGGFILCKFTGFLDFFMLAEYPILIIVFGIILLTRKFPKQDDEVYDDINVPMDEMIEHQSTRSSNINTSRNGYRGGGVPAFSPNGSSTPSKPPSVVGSVDGYRVGHGSNPYRPQRLKELNPQYGPKRPGSVTGSIEGRLANSRGGRRSHHQQVPFMASSPLPEVDEDVGDALDLWESASMDYPGRDIDEPHGWEFMDEQEVSYEEPRYHTWHLWLASLTWALALSVGIPAVFMVTHKTETGRNLGNGHEWHENVAASRPGCYVDVNPFKNPQFITINDPGFNFNLAVVILFYIIAVGAMLIVLILVHCRKTKNTKYQRYVKILTWYCVIFAVSRSPIDIWQLKALIETAMGFRSSNQVAYELEYEVLFVWLTYIPLVVHPILYFSFCSEFLKGSKTALRNMCGCQQLEQEKEDAKLNNYKEEEILEARSTVSKTQVSNML